MPRILTKASQVTSRWVEKSTTMALDGCRLTIELANAVSPLIPVPGVVAGVQAVQYLIRMVDMMRGNEAERIDLLGHLEGFTGLMQQALERLKVEPSTGMSQRLVGQLDLVTREIGVMAEQVMTMGGSSRLARLVKSQERADQLSGISVQVQRLIERFKIECLVELRGQMGDLRSGIDSVQTGVETVQTGVVDIRTMLQAMQSGFGTIQMGIESANMFAKTALDAVLSQDEMEILNRLPREEVGYQSEINRVKHGVLQGTRQSVLDMIVDWIERPFDPSTSDDKSFFILSGVAGCGKSTIAYTTAELLDRLGLLGASHFFSRDDMRLSKLTDFIPSLSRQVAISTDDARPPIVDAVRARPTLGPFPLGKDFNDLLVNPLSTVNGRTQPVFVVIDAVDECKDRKGISEFLYLIYSQLPKLEFPLRVFITGRPDVQNDFTDRSSCILHELDVGDVLTDIVRYLTYEFGLLRAENNLPAEWPPREVIPKLSNDAGNLFVYVSTGIGYLRTPDILSIHQRLDLWMDLKSNPHEEPQVALDRLYIQVLGGWLNQFPSEVAVNRRLNILLPILGHIVLTFQPLSPDSLVTLLSQSRTSAIHSTPELKSRLHPLSSVIPYPSQESGTIKGLHASFADFLTDESRCAQMKDSGLRFYVDPEVHHAEIAESCLKLLSEGLKSNILDLPSPLILNSKIPNLSDKIASHIPDILRYACCYGIDHVVSVNQPRKSLVADVKIFADTALIKYVEVMSLLGKVGDALRALGKLATWYQAHALTNQDEETKSLLSDCERLVSVFFDVISVSAGHVKASALNMAPGCALRRRYFRPEDARCSLLQGREACWSPCRRTISYNSACWAATFSPDDLRVASGLEDGTIVISDATTGGTIKSFRAHSGTIYSLAYSHDILASASSNSTIGIWDATTGREVKRLSVSGKGFPSVSLSPDGKLVAGGCTDSTVRVWELKSGELFATLEGHSKQVNSVSFSPNGDILASGSADKTILLWDVKTWKILKTLSAHTKTVTSLSFSHDTSYLVSGSYDTTAKIWNIEDGTVVKTLKHDNSVDSVAFSNDGQRVVCGTGYGSIVVWSAGTGEKLRALDGHTSFVRLVVCSSNGHRLVSGSLDKTARLWEVEGSSQEDGLIKVFAGTITFSVDGTCFCINDCNFFSSDGEILPGSTPFTCFVPSGSNVPESPFFFRSADIDPSTHNVLLLDHSGSVVFILPSSFQGNGDSDYPFVWVVSPDSRTLVLVGGERLFVFQM